MAVPTMTSKGQIVIPSSIRRELELKSGTKFSVSVENGSIIFAPMNKNYFRQLRGILGTEGRMLKSLMEDKKFEREL